MQREWLRMDPEVKAVWLTDLRSGEYQQTTARLRDQDGYCCLGVLCDRYRKSHPGTQWELLDIGHYSFRGSTDALPNEVMLWAGLTQRNPEVDVRKTESSIERRKPLSGTLGDINDAGNTFDEIANIIDEQF
jgi:hypothetical protein